MRLRSFDVVEHGVGRRVQAVARVVERKRPQAAKVQRSTTTAPRTKSPAVSSKLWWVGFNRSLHPYKGGFIWAVPEGFEGELPTQRCEALTSPHWGRVYGSKVVKV